MQSISIIIPTFNEEGYIKTLLNSIRKQHFNMCCVEIIVVDNGSNDTTTEILKNYGRKYPKLNLVITTEKKKHVSAARNKGARIASGIILVFLDADNMLYENFIQDVYQKAFIEGYNAGTIFTLPLEESTRGYKIFLLLELIKIVVGIPFGKNFCTKRLFNAIGGYNEGIIIGTNLDFLIRIKKQLKTDGRSMAHIQKPIFTSLRRFEKTGYVKVLIRWLLGYIGFRTISYSRDYKKL